MVRHALVGAVKPQYVEYKSLAGFLSPGLLYPLLIQLVQDGPNFFPLQGTMQDILLTEKFTDGYMVC